MRAIICVFSVIFIALGQFVPPASQSGSVPVPVVSSAAAPTSQQQSYVNPHSQQQSYANPQSQQQSYVPQSHTSPSVIAQHSSEVKQPSEQYQHSSIYRQPSEYKQQSSHKKNDDQHSGDRWYNDRDVVCQHDSDHVEFVSNNSAAGDRIHFQTDFDTASLRFTADFYDNSSAHKNVVSARVRVAFITIVEFEEKSAAFDGYNASIDTVVSSVSLSRRGWSNITSPVKTTNADGSVVYTFSASWGGLVTLTSTVSDSQFQASGNVTYPPSQTKIDVAISGYAYKGTGTYLAIGVVVQSPETLQRNFAKHGASKGVPDAVNFAYGDDDNVMAFGWNRTVLADGVEVAVITSEFVAQPNAMLAADDSAAADTASAEVANKVFYAFNAVQPAKLEWDPYVGLQTATTVTGSASGLAVSFVMASVLALAAMFL